MLLFALRVLAQPLAAHWPTDMLPSFDDWYSATLPYSVLLVSQGVILVIGLYLSWRVFSHRLALMPVLGNWLYRFGWVYWLVMFARLMFGITILNGVHWFAQTLPALFHLLLANFLMLLGDDLRSDNRQGVTR